MRKLSLIKLGTNKKGEVCEINAGPTLINRFMSMGIYKGKVITKLSQFAMEGPVAIKVGRSVLALGHGMAAKIMVETDD